MPTYSFQCKKCESSYDDLVDNDPTGKYKGVKCPSCGSKSKTKLMTFCAVSFTNPRDTSKWDNFTFRAGKTMEEAQDCRRYAQEHSHVGANPYGAASDAQIAADINNDANWGEVK